MLFKSLAALGLATTVMADAATILASLQTVVKANALLNNSVANWDGGAIAAFGIAGNLVAVLNDINDAANVAYSSANLTSSDASQIYSLASSLASDVNGTLINIEAVHPKADVIFAGPVFLDNLIEAKIAADNLSKNLIAKVPAKYAAEGAALTKQLDIEFEAAIDVYQP